MTRRILSRLWAGSFLGFGTLLLMALSSGAMANLSDPKDNSSLPQPGESLSPLQEKALDFLLEAEDLLSQGQAEEALEVVEAGLGLDPSQGKLHYIKGEIFSALDRPKEAEEAYQAAVAASPLDPVLRKRVIRRMNYAEGPPWPEDSLVLFRDHLCLGCRVRAEPAASRVLTRYGDGALGVAALEFRAAPDKSFELSLRLSDAQAGALGKYLFLARETGALRFHIKAGESTDALEVGFRERPRAWADHSPEVIMSLAPYLNPTGGLEEVLVPLADFPQQGSVPVARKARADEGHNPQVTDIEDRREVPFRWDRAQEVFIRGLPAPGEERGFVLDHMGILPQAPEAKDLRLRRLRNEGARAERLKTRGLRIFEDHPWGLAYAFLKPFSTLVVDETTSVIGRTSARVELNPLKWSGAGFRFPETDLRALREDGFLSFYLKGSRGGESFRIHLHSRRGGGERVVSEGPDIRTLLDVTDSWQTVNLPLADFPDGGLIWHESYEFNSPEVFNWQRVAEISFDTPPLDEQQNTFYVDSLRLTLDKLPAPELKKTDSRP